MNLGAMAPPHPLANVHQTYGDLYADAAWDPMGGNYINLYADYIAAATTPAVLRERLYNSGNAGALIHILAHIRDPAADPADPGHIVAYHRLSRHVALAVTGRWGNHSTDKEMSSTDKSL